MKTAAEAGVAPRIWYAILALALGCLVQISWILGSTLAGLVVKAIGEAPAFFLNGVSFLVVIASLASWT